MARVDSTDPRWPGYIVLPEYMTYPVLARWETALDRAKTVSELDAQKSSSGFFMELLPIACELVLEWHINGLPEKVTGENFPAATKFLSFVTGCVSDLYTSTNEPVDLKVPASS
jgi:hypothetical protein